MVRTNNNVTDPVADLLSRIRNANVIASPTLVAPVSKINEAVLRILRDEGFVESFDREGEGVESSFLICLKYGKDRERTITGLRRVSKPGRRVYAKRGELPRVLGGLGVAIVSTSKGVMTDREASRQHVGGEVLAYVW